MPSSGELLALVSENPDDDARWILLADFMQETGDPRGELIALDVALETDRSIRRSDLAARRAELLAQHAAELLGPTLAKVVAEGYGSVVWRRGFVEELAYTGDARLRHQRGVAWLVRDIARHHEPFRFVRKLDFTRTDLADLAPLAQFAHLEQLLVGGTRVVELAPLHALPALRRLDVRDCDLAKGALDALKAARPRVTVVR